MARCLAVAISHAPGLSGTPDSGHCSRAATKASCARSSAMPTSPTMRARPAMSRGDSILQTASIARCVSVAVTATDHIMFNPSSASRRTPRLLVNGFLLRLLALRLLEHLANLGLTIARHFKELLCEFDRLWLRLRLDQRKASDHLLRLGKGTVGHDELSSRKPDARPLHSAGSPQS